MVHYPEKQTAFAFLCVPSANPCALNDEGLAWISLFNIKPCVQLLKVLWCVHIHGNIGVRHGHVANAGLVRVLHVAGVAGRG